MIVHKNSRWKRFVFGGISSVCLLVLMRSGLAERLQEKNAGPEDIDSFMAKVLEKREINWDELHGYVFNEREIFEIKGARIPALESFRREYVWFVRDGYLVRSPLRVNGVEVAKNERTAYEESWAKNKNKSDSLDRESFLQFKFEPGNYLYAGQRTFEGREVVLVEYYPRRATSEKQGKKSRVDKEAEKYEDMFYKTSLVTMLIEPKEHQIVRIAFDNVGLEFLPYRWLVRLDELNASMVMNKPLGDVWLPRVIRASGTLIAASASLTVTYSREFYDYAKTEVKVKFRFEK